MIEFDRSILLPENNNSIWLDIGCGINKAENCIGIDKIPSKCTDYVCDVERKGIPFSGSTVDGIVMLDVIGYLDDWLFVMQEIYRVLKPGGTVEIYYPIGISKICPGYKKPWWPEMFKVFDLDNPKLDSEYKHLQKSLEVSCNFKATHEKVKEKDIGHVTLRAVKEYPKNFIPVLSMAGGAINCGKFEAVRVELACGWSKRMDPYPFIGVDRCAYKDHEIAGEPIVDIVKDLERGVPFADDSVDIIFVSHFMEHTKDLIGVIEECYRVLKQDGVLEMINPWWKSVHAYQNPDHKRLIHPVLWSYWNAKGPSFDHEAYGIKAQFLDIRNEQIEDGLLTVLFAKKDASREFRLTGSKE